MLLAVGSLLDSCHGFSAQVRGMPELTLRNRFALMLIFSFRLYEHAIFWLDPLISIPAM